MKANIAAQGADREGPEFRFKSSASSHFGTTGCREEEPTPTKEGTATTVPVSPTGRDARLGGYGRVRVAWMRKWSEGMTPTSWKVVRLMGAAVTHAFTGSELVAKIQSMLFPIRLWWSS